MKKILVVALVLLSIGLHAQTEFKQGYFVRNDGEKVECLIKFVDWTNNPTIFEYKLSENAETKDIGIQDVAEFEIVGISKFQRHEVDLDRSSDQLGYLSSNSKPEFKSEILFLQILIDGPASLYSYDERGLRRLFYKLENGPVKPLVYKKYSIEQTKIGENESYKQELYLNLKCESINKSVYEKLSYNRRSVMSLFRKYYQCLGVDYSDYSEKYSKSKLNISLKGRLNLVSFSMASPETVGETIEFDDKVGFGFGVEFEWLLPLKKNNWAIIFEPNYLSYTDSQDLSTQLSSQVQNQIADIEYRTIQIPFGLRRYFQINDNLELFLNAFFVPDFPTNSTISFSLFRIPQELDFNSNFAIGCGFKFTERLSGEFRYNSSRDITAFDSDFRLTEIIIGYRIR